MRGKSKEPPHSFVFSGQREMIADGYSLLDSCIYGHIRWCTRHECEYFYSNEYLGKFFGFHRNTIQKSIDILVSTGLIYRDTIQEGNRSIRYLSIVDDEVYKPKID